MATVNDTLSPQLLYLISSKLNSHLLTLSHQSSFLRGHVHLCTCVCNTHVHINTYFNIETFRIQMIEATNYVEIVSGSVGFAAL